MSALRPLLLLGLAAAAAGPAQGDRSHTGLHTQTDFLAPGTQHVYFGAHTRFRGQERAEVLVAGDGAADLDLYVYDEEGNLICRRDSIASSEYCAWTPRWTGQFRIVVRNAGDVGTSYMIRRS